MTATHLAYQAARDIGVMRPGQTLSQDSLNDILESLNQMLDQWQLDRFMVFSERADSYPMTAGIQYYLIGPGAAPTVIGGVQFGAFNTVRPVEIDRANIIINTVMPVVRYPCHNRNAQQWAAIRVQNIPFAIPQVFYYDKNFNSSGQAVVNFWPGPQATYLFEAFTWQQLQSFADLTTNYAFPPGYANCIRKNLAVEIAPMMKVYFKIPEPLLDRVTEQARKAKEDVMSYNAPDPVANCDSAFRGSGRGGGWIYATGESGRR